MEWEFGHGLSYTTFEYSDFTVTAQPAANKQTHKRAPKTAAKGVSAGECMSICIFRQCTADASILRAISVSCVFLLQSHKIIKFINLIIPQQASCRRCL